MSRKRLCTPRNGGSKYQYQFEKEIRLVNETRSEEVRVSYVNTKTLDQLEEWMKEKPILYISNDKFSQEDIFQYWTGCLPGHSHVNQVYPDVVRMWRQFHGYPASGGGIERVFFSVTTKESSQMIIPPTGNGSSLRW